MTAMGGNRLRVVLVAALGMTLVGEVAARPCGGAAAAALRLDVTRARQWNWGWSLTLGASAVAVGGLAYYTDDANMRLAFGLTATKSSLGALKHALFPIRIEGPSEGCTDLERKLRWARSREQKSHNWFAHASGLVLNIAGFLYIGYATDDWLLATRSSVVGLATGELIIYTSPNSVRSGDFLGTGISLIPMIGSDRQGILLGGEF
ncbi:MAG: hypothetical protein JKY56_06205 [Kofleriaceae bacterium]|nr:hypothetical protein [Kofleriaceae bacterium]